MANNIVQTNIQELLEGWLEAERNGIAFPVPFHDHWNIAGHSTKQKAFELVEALLEEGFDFLTLRLKTPGKSGRPVKAMNISVAALEHLCMAAQTPQGRNVRELYRQAKAKWDLVQKHAPQVAKGVELLHLQIELAKIEAQKESAIAQGKQADLQLIQFRHIVTTTMPEIVQQKILGCTVIEKVEYRDRIIRDDDIIRDGSTINKTEMCRRLGLVSKSGAPNYKRLNEILVASNIPPEAWRLTASLRENEELDLNAWFLVERDWRSSDRQQYLGE